MRFRPLIVVAALVGVDYLVWTLSQGAGSTLAVVSGLAFPPLAIALLWLAIVQIAAALNRPRRLEPRGQVQPRIRLAARARSRARALTAAVRGARHHGKPASGSPAKSSRIPA